MMYDRPFFLPVLQAGDCCGYGDDPDRKNGFSDQAVQEGTFPGFKLSQDGYIYQLILLKKIFAGFNLAVQGGDMKLIADLLNSGQ